MSLDNPALSKASQDVPPAPSSGTEGSASAATTPDSDAGKQSSDAGGKKKGERTLDEVRGEFDRKHGVLEAGISEIRGMLQGMAQQRAVQPAAPPAGAPSSLEDMTAAQLEALRPQVKDEQKAVFEDLLGRKKQDESIASTIQTQFQQRDLETARERHSETAFGRWPELHSQGKLRDMTNKILNDKGATATSDPRAVLDAANEAGLALGLTPKGMHMMGRNFSGSHPGGGTAPPDEGAAKGAPQITEERLAYLAKRYKGALPKGKFTDEALDRIRENSAAYRDHQHLFIRQ